MRPLRTLSHLILLALAAYLGIAKGATVDGLLLTGVAVTAEVDGLHRDVVTVRQRNRIRRDLAVARHAIVNPPR